MFQYFNKTKVATAARNAVMEAVNHLKNSAMEADTKPVFNDYNV